MPIENAGFISELDPLNPDGQDDYATADDHIRLMKAVLKGQFPNFTAEAINALVADLNVLTGADAAGITPAKIAFLADVTSAIQEQIDDKQTQLDALSAEVDTKLELVTGNFVGTLTGFITNKTPSLRWQRVGDHLVTLWLVDASQGNDGNGSSLTLQGLPAEIRPSIDRRVICNAINGSHVPALAIVLTTGTIQFHSAQKSGASNAISFQNSWDSTQTLQKGLPSGWSITYSL